MIGPKSSVILQRAVETADGSGGYTETWKDLCILRGTMYSDNGNHRFMHNRIETASTHIFTFDMYTPWNDSISESDQLRYSNWKGKNDSFEIVFVDSPCDQGRSWSLYLREIK
jgi:head-tail adaptor